MKDFIGISPDGKIFVAEFKDFSLQNITKITQNEYNFYNRYKGLELQGYLETEKKHTLGKLLHYRREIFL